MNDTEEVTKQLIDAIELYINMLDDVGKPLLINYFLKTRLSVSTKLRIPSKTETWRNSVGVQKCRVYRQCTPFVRSMPYG